MFNTNIPLTIIDACPGTGPAAYGRKKFLAVLKDLGCRFDIVKDIHQCGS